MKVHATSDEKVDSFHLLDRIGLLFHYFIEQRNLTKHTKTTFGFVSLFSPPFGLHQIQCHMTSLEYLKW